MRDETRTGREGRLPGEVVETYTRPLLAQEVVEYCGKAIGAAAVSMIHALNPDIILFSGGVAEQGDLLVRPIREYVKTHALYNTRNTPVRIAELSSQAGVIGAAALILNG